MKKRNFHDMFSLWFRKSFIPVVLHNKVLHTFLYTPCKILHKIVNLNDFLSSAQNYFYEFLMNFLFPLKFLFSLFWRK